MSNYMRFSTGGSPRMDCEAFFHEVFPWRHLPSGFAHSWNAQYSDSKIQAAILEAKRWEKRQNNEKATPEVAKVVSSILRKGKALVDAELLRRRQLC